MKKLIFPLVGLTIASLFIASCAVSETTQNTTENNSSGLEISQTEKGDYDVLNLEELPPDVVLTGTDPQTIALEAFPSPVVEEGNPVQEEISVNQMDNLAVVDITRMGLPDDSVQGIRYLIEFETTADEQWQMTWVGRQYICRPGRGSQDWSKQLCS